MHRPVEALAGERLLVQAVVALRSKTQPHSRLELVDDARRVVDERPGELLVVQIPARRRACRESGARSSRAGRAPALKPPCTMRVQPERPTAPLLTTTTSRLRMRCRARCSRHISPAPPLPTIATSVSSVSYATSGQDLHAHLARKLADRARRVEPDGHADVQPGRSGNGRRPAAARPCLQALLSRAPSRASAVEHSARFSAAGPR